VVTGATADSNRSTAMLYERTVSQGWRSVAGPWPAHNALRGWSADHRAGDLRTPVGVFGLGDAGGRLPDPGTRLPYDQDPEFAVSGTGFHGEPLEGSFDYVVAIDYNRVPGTTPLDKTRPLGADRGGGVWIHVDHGGPTQACVSLTQPHLRSLLRALDPDKRPVVVMGPATALAK
jgi:L,D-peptidoglycan transpeptidase YkuD (ErfK/YbiS/YcfS/YnhG family)